MSNLMYIMLNVCKKKEKKYYVFVINLEYQLNG